MAAVAGVALQNLMDDRDSEEWWTRFVIGAVSEGIDGAWLPGNM